MMHGCFCDEGYEGYDCSRTSCPTGDDPGTQPKDGPNPHKHETQLIRCLATGGKFKLEFRSQTTAELDWDISAADLKTALLGLSSIGTDISVTYSEGTTFCRDYYPDNHVNVVSITFTQDLGDVPSIVMHFTTNANPLSFSSANVCADFVEPASGSTYCESGGLMNIVVDGNSFPITVVLHQERVQVRAYLELWRMPSARIGVLATTRRVLATAFPALPALMEMITLASGATAALKCTI